MEPGFHLLHFTFNDQVGNLPGNLFFAQALHRYVKFGLTNIEPVHGIQQSVHIVFHEIGNEYAQLLMKVIYIRNIFTTNQLIITLQLKIFADQITQYDVFFFIHSTSSFIPSTQQPSPSTQSNTQNPTPNTS